MKQRAHWKVVEAERRTLRRIRELAHTLAEVTEAYMSMARDSQDPRHVAGSEMLQTMHAICGRLNEAVASLNSLPDPGK